MNVGVLQVFGIINGNRNLAKTQSPIKLLGYSWYVIGSAPIVCWINKVKV